MAIIKLQGEKEKLQGIYYEFDANSKPLGEGGMGKVYRGRRVNMQTHETRDVAIKFMFAYNTPDFSDQCISQTKKISNFAQKWEKRQDVSTRPSSRPR